MVFPRPWKKLLVEDSRIPPAITFLKPLSAAISIGTGGPFGAEGPIIATGGAFGSLTGQLMHISSGERKIILAAGACAGMSTIFGTPLAAVMLAVELLLFEFSPRSIIPVIYGLHYRSRYAYFFIWKSTCFCHGLPAVCFGECIVDVHFIWIDNRSCCFRYFQIRVCNRGSV